MDKIDQEKNYNTFVKPMYVYNIMCDCVESHYQNTLDKCGFDISVNGNIIKITDRNGGQIPVTFKEIRQAIPYLEGIIAGSSYGTNPE